MNLLKQAMFLTPIALSLLFTTQAYAHRTASDGVIHHVAPSACQIVETAEAEARDLAIKSAKDYCRKEGFGWRAATIKDIGNLDCRRCDGGRVKCGYTGLALECRKAEPQLSLLEWFSVRP